MHIMLKVLINAPTEFTHIVHWNKTAWCREGNNFIDTYRHTYINIVD